MKCSLIALLGAFVAAEAQSVWNMQAKPNPQPLKAANGATVLEVMVGGPAGTPSEKMFAPNNIAAKAGQVVRFVFMTQNQSIAQTTFANPCTAMKNGVSSGPKPMGDGTSPPTFDFAVKSSTDPVFMMAENDNACAVGFVFVINPSKQQSATAFMGAAMGMGESSGSQQPANGLVAQGAVSQTSATQTVTFAVQGAAAATGSQSAPSSAPTVSGSGQNGQGQTCSCSCLCGSTQMPQGAGQNMFGGFLGEMEQSPVGAGMMASAGAAMAAPSKRSLPMPPMKRVKA